eukprot:m.196641 g.196641  ORF g.196641 m.196641 type:complete len:182 (+) comp39534_c0_seq11:1897-2442(+)
MELRSTTTRHRLLNKTKETGAEVKRQAKKHFLMAQVYQREPTPVAYVINVRLSGEFDSDSSATHFTTTSHSETDSGYVNFQVLNAQRSAVKEEGHTKAGSEKDLKANPKLKSVSTAEFSVLPFPKTQPSMVSCSEKMGYCRRPIQGCKQPEKSTRSSPIKNIGVKTIVRDFEKFLVLKTDN